MRRLIPAALLLWLIPLASLTGQDPQEKKDDKDPRGREGTLKVGDLAPEFALKEMIGTRSVSLSGLKGKPVVLFFGSCT